MQLYAITDRRLFATPAALVDKAVLWAKSGVDFIQIREKDLAVEELSALTVRIVHAVRSVGSRTRILLNGSAELAIATGCDGVHLTAGLSGSAITDAGTALVRVVPDPLISVSCHTLPEIERTRDAGATLALFAPVFEKRSDEKIVSGQGLDVLTQACRIAGTMPVFALGGVTARNAQDCVKAGVAGIAAIRLFMSGDWLDLRAVAWGPHDPSDKRG